MWWREDCLLAVAMSDKELSEGACRESLVQFSLSVDQERKVVKISKW